MNKPTKIILHHSLTDDGKLLSSFDAIKRYHMEHNGWSDIGYHFLLEYVGGKLIWEEGRDILTHGAHCLEENYTSIGICIVGNFDKDFLTDEHVQMILQKQTELEILLDQNLPILFHREYAPYKTCPGKNITYDMFKAPQQPTDVSEWAREAREHMMYLGVTDGDRPKDNCTREEIWTMLYRLTQTLK